MPETPANDELVSPDDAVEPTPSAAVSGLPRTVKNRASRRVQVNPSVTPAATSESFGQVAEQPESDAEAPQTVGSQLLAENELPAETEEDEAVIQETQNEAVGDEVDSQQAAESDSPREGESAPGAEGAQAEPEPAASHAEQGRTVRIEVPVPSVVRARERAEIASQNPVVLHAESLTKSYGQVLAAADVSFDVHAGSLTGVVGPNGAGKTTVLSMISGLNRPTSGRIFVRDIDVWGKGPAAKRLIGSLPDRLRLFDRLTGGQLLYYSGVLQGLDQSTVAQRSAELAVAFGLESALDRPVSDYSAGMQKKIGLACSMIHSPEVLVLDEPYETIDPVSASNVTEILEKYVAGGGSVIMSSHSLDLIQRICDHAVVIVDGSVVAQGTVDEVRGGVSLEERFRHLTRNDEEGKGLEWLRGSSDFD